MNKFFPTVFVCCFLLSSTDCVLDALFFALRKLLHPESYQRAVYEHYQRVKEENEEKRKKLIKHKKR